MTQPTAVFNPPVFPLQPQVPPPQTVTGVLNEVGLPILNTSPMNGQPPNQDFWLARQEFITSVLAAHNNDHIMTLDILKCDRPGEQSDTLLCTNRPLLANPRTYFLNSCQHVDCSVTYTFWAIKPLATAGKIRIVYVPDAAFDVETGSRIETGPVAPEKCYIDGKEVPYVVDATQRNYVWEWDLKAQNVISLTFKGNSPLGTIPTNFSQPLGNKIPILPSDDGLPFFQTTYGLLSFFWQNAYLPGSIYPDTFNIAVFKSLAGTKGYVQTGFRSGARMNVR